MAILNEVTIWLTIYYMFVSQIANILYAHFSKSHFYPPHFYCSSYCPTSPDERRSEWMKILILSLSDRLQSLLWAQSNKLNEQQLVLQRVFCRGFFALGFTSQATYRLPDLVGEGCVECSLTGIPANAVKGWKRKWNLLHVFGVKKKIV